MRFGFDDLVRATAPRALLVCAPRQDEVFSFVGVQKPLPAIRSHYAGHDQGDRFQALLPDYGHRFGEQERAQAYAFLDRHLRPGADAG